jgi:predicted metal-dependent peptidase
MTAAVDLMKQAETNLKRAHLRIMKHKLTYLYAGVLMLGESKVVTAAESGCPTAYTDGVNKYYAMEYLNSLTIEQIVEVVLHENFHVVLKHLPRHRDLWKEDPQLTNAAADYVVNDWIEQIREQDPALVKWGPNPLLDPQFRNWSVRQVYNFLKTGQDKDGKQQGKPQQGKPQQGQQGQGPGKPKPGQSEEATSVKIGGKTYDTTPRDKHDWSKAAGAKSDEIKEQEAKIDQAIQQSALIAGAMGADIPRAIKELLTPEEDWRDVMQDFVTQSMSGRDEYSYRRYNVRRLADDLYRPSTISERIGRLVVAIDTSGSIRQEDISRVCGALALICEQVNPEEVVVLWWDTEVHAEQVLYGNYSNLADVLKPVGGGGTQLSCVSDYLNDRRMDADCMVVFTDGYVESNVRWSTRVPALWVVKGNSRFAPPSGALVEFK